MRIEDMVFHGGFRIYYVVRTIWMQGRGATVICKHDLYAFSNQVKEEMAQEDYGTQDEAILGHENWLRRLHEDLEKRGIA